MNAECAWCTDPVAEDGDTCNVECYRAILIVHGLDQVPMTETLPKDMHEQPWYRKYLGE